MQFATRRSRVAAATITAVAMMLAVLASIAADRGTAAAEPVPNSLAAALALGQKSTAGPVFAKFDGIDGEATDADHEKWINVLSFRWSAQKPDGDAGSRRRGDAVIDDVGLKIPYSKASPKIAEALLKGKVFPKVEVEFTANFGGQRQTYLRYELTNVMVTSYATNASGKKLPKDNISMNFEEIKVTYTEYDDQGQSKGNVEFSWKVEPGEK